jgi:hypothetical protein
MITTELRFSVTKEGMSLIRRDLGKFLFSSQYYPNLTKSHKELNDPNTKPLMKTSYEYFERSEKNTCSARVSYGDPTSLVTTFIGIRLPRFR